jgi:hypothetical protein
MGEAAMNCLQQFSRQRLNSYCEMSRRLPSGSLESSRCAGQQGQLKRGIVEIIFVQQVLGKEDGRPIVR